MEMEVDRYPDVNRASNMSSLTINSSRAPRGTAFPCPAPVTLTLDRQHSSPVPPMDSSKNKTRTVSDGISDLFVMRFY